VGRGAAFAPAAAALPMQASGGDAINVGAEGGWNSKPSVVTWVSSPLASPSKRVLHLRKRALYICKRALYFCKPALHTANQPYISAKEHCTSAKEPYSNAEDAYYISEPQNTPYPLTR